MKASSFICFVLLFFILACSKENDEAVSGKNNTDTNATILSKGMDCGDVWLADLDPSNDTMGEHNIYYLVNLPDQYKIYGLRVKVETRPAAENESVICSTRGISYLQLFVRSIR